MVGHRCSPRDNIFTISLFRCRYLQNRGFGASRETLGPTQESSGDELRQTEPVDPTVLQEGHHQEDGQFKEARLPVLHAVRLNDSRSQRETAGPRLKEMSQRSESDF